MISSLLLAAALLPFARAEDAPQPRLGEKVPAFKLKTVQGDEVSSDSFLGSWAVLQFGASWCPFTNKKAPFLVALNKDYSGKRVKTAVIDIAEEKGKAADWAARKGFTMPVLLDADGKVSVSFLPAEIKHDPRYEAMTSASVILDPRGRIRYFQLPNEEDNDEELDSLTEKLDALLKEKPKK
jgi:peroxiredoxin